MIRIRLRDSVYVLEEPTTGMAYQVRGDAPRLKPRATASFFDSAKAALEAAVQHLGGQKYELVRVDA